MAHKSTDLFARWLSLSCFAVSVATITGGVSALQASEDTGAPERRPTAKSSSSAAVHHIGTSAVIRDIRRTVLPEAVRITIELDREVPFQDERLDNPARVFVDLRSTRALPGLTAKTLRFDGDNDPVHQIRVGRHPGNTTRVVLEAAGVVAYNIYQLYSPYRLVIDCARRAPSVGPTLQAKAASAPMPLTAGSTLQRAVRPEPTTIQPVLPPPPPEATILPVLPKLPVIARPLANQWSRTIRTTGAPGFATEVSQVESRPPLIRRLPPHPLPARRLGSSWSRTIAAAPVAGFDTQASETAPPSMGPVQQRPLPARRLGSSWSRTIAAAPVLVVPRASEIQSRPPLIRPLPQPLLPARRLGSSWSRTIAANPVPAVIAPQGSDVESLTLSIQPAVSPPLTARRLGNSWSRTIAATPVPALAGQLSEVDSSPPPTDAVAARSKQTPPTPPVTAARSTRRGGYTIARQLGLGVSRIVIDPGHGGHDHGAQGNGIDEAELVLDVALRLEKLLTNQGTDVVLTRRTNQFVSLQERTALANREGADLFLSIHANANANPQVRGIESYILNFASNLSAAAVAKRENAASGQAMAALPDLVKEIALNNKLDESRELATLVQRTMVERLRTSNQGLKDLGVKQAPFVVLIGAAMPSVLTEISFLTNPHEAKLLKNSGYRQRIAEALFNAVRKYQTSLKSVPTVAGTRE